MQMHERKNLAKKKEKNEEHVHVQARGMARMPSASAI